jgi:ribosomal protein S18 acetylase RimI-like enzyme
MHPKYKGERFMKIRKMTITDYAQVYSLWSNAAGMGLRDIDDNEQAISKYLDRNPSTCFVAEKNNQIIGVVLGGHDGRRGHLCHMAVSKNEQGQGIGTELVNTVMSAFANEGISKVALVCFSNNKHGNDFWERQGFFARTDLVYRDKATRGVTL